MHKTYFRGVAVISFTLFLTALTHAQASRTWVSGVGDDANPCSRTAPCKTFAGAISKTAAAGEINCIDPGSFGAVTITKSLTINCSNTTATVIVAGTNGITINLVDSNKTVRLQGLRINGLGTTAGTPSLRGISMVSGGTLIIEDVVIDGFTDPSLGYGISVTGGAQVSVARTTIRNSRIGVNVAPSTGSGDLTLNNSSIAFNTTGLNSDANATVRLAHTSVTYNNLAIGTANGGQVISYGNNTLEHNTNLGPIPQPGVTH